MVGLCSQWNVHPGKNGVRLDAWSAVPCRSCPVSAGCEAELGFSLTGMVWLAIDTVVLLVIGRHS